MLRCRVQRDIKPQNLLLNPKSHEVKLCDFGSAKCFARGTQVRLSDGGLINVEDVVGGERLMGPDGQPRIVTPGSTVRGRAVMYEIVPAWAGAEAFVVNAAHILVLTNAVEPSLSGSSERGWRVCWFELDARTNAMSRRVSSAFFSEGDARDCLAALLAEWSGPLQWEVSVADFLSAPTAVRLSCTLMQSGPITFASGLDRSVASVLTKLIGRAPSAEQSAWAAWYLGMWMADGSSHNAWIAQGGALPPSPQQHQEICAKLLRYPQVFPGERVQQRLDSSAGSPVLRFQYRVGSVADGLLRAYDLLHHKRIPQAWVCDSLDVRRCILAGMMDGGGHCASDVCIFIAGSKRVADGCKLLAASLGLRNGEVTDACSRAVWKKDTSLRAFLKAVAAPAAFPCDSDRAAADEDAFISDDDDLMDEDEDRRYRLAISGDMSAVTQHCAAGHKKRPQRATPLSLREAEASRCYGIRRITELPESDFFGFAVHGGVDRRFLLRDFTITHNVSPPQHPSLHPTPSSAHL